MKKCVLQIISLCLAVFMAYVGGGVNIYHYCCDACEELNQFIIHNFIVNDSKTFGSQFIIEDTQSTCSHECCIHQHSEDEPIAFDKIQFTNDSDKCGVARVEAPDLWKFSSEKESFVVLPLVVLLPYNTIQTLCDETQYIASLHYADAHSIVQKQTGRAIIVRKSAYLI